MSSLLQTSCSLSLKNVVCLLMDLCTLLLLLLADPMVKFVRGALEKAGCPVGDKFFKPEECSMQVGGGFKRDDGVRFFSVTLIFDHNCASISCINQCTHPNANFSCKL